jgi:hypothetical protein
LWGRLQPACALLYANPHKGIGRQPFKAGKQIRHEREQGWQTVVMCGQYDDSQGKGGNILLVLKVLIRGYEDIEPGRRKRQKPAVLYA